jgi:seryl-tRNA synthetase
MYDIKWIRENPDAFDRGLKRRGLEPLSKKLLALDEKRRTAITKFEQAQARRNAASKEIGDAKKAKDEGKANKLIAGARRRAKDAWCRAGQGIGANPQHAAR